MTNSPKTPNRRATRGRAASPLVTPAAHCALVLSVHDVLRELAVERLELARYRVVTVANAGQAARLLRSDAVALLVVDDAVCVSQGINRLVADVQLLGLVAPAIVVMGGPRDGPSQFGKDVASIAVARPVSAAHLDAGIAAAQLYGLDLVDRSKKAETLDLLGANTYRYSTVSSDEGLAALPANAFSATDSAPPAIPSEQPPAAPAKKKERVGRFATTLSFRPSDVASAPSPEAVIELPPDSVEPVELFATATAGSGDIDDFSETTEMPAIATEHEGMPSVIVGDYLLTGVLGRGGAATVYRAIHTETNQPVALKVLDRGTSVKQAGSRFRQEMEICRQLNHPNIVSTYSIGTWNEHSFYSMELMNGRDLSEILRDEDRPLSLSRVTDWIFQACDGLAAAHDADVIHRDVKPENLFLTDAGVIKIMDFGIARRQSMSLTETNDKTVLGTPIYMPPERLSNKRLVTERTDVYSVGASMYHLLTNDVPFDLTDLTTLLFSIVEGTIAPPSSLVPSIPKSVDAVILRAMARKPTDRYPNCRAFARDLRRAVAR